jgi:hypothetical protein
MGMEFFIGFCLAKSLKVNLVTYVDAKTFERLIVEKAPEHDPGDNKI